MGRGPYQACNLILTHSVCSLGVNDHIQLGLIHAAVISADSGLLNSKYETFKHVRFDSSKIKQTFLLVTLHAGLNF